MANVPVFSIDTRAGATGATIPTGTTLVETAGATVLRDYGNAPYIIGSTDTASFLNSNPDWGFVDSAGQARIVYGRALRPQMFRRTTDASNDDTASFQRFRDGMNQMAYLDGGTYAVRQSLILDRQYNITQPGALSQQGTTKRLSGFTMVGVNRSAGIVYNPATPGPLIFNDDSLSSIEFSNVTFTGAGNAAGGSLWESRSTGGAQAFFFNGLQIKGRWGDQVWLLRADSQNNNAEVRWHQCTFGLDSGYESVIFRSLGSDQHLNYWFSQCNSQLGGAWVDMKKGGNLSIRDCDASGLRPAVDTWLFNLGDAIGEQHAGGVCRATIDGFRVEHANPRAKLLRSRWNYGTVSVSNYDGSSQVFAVADVPDNILVQHGDTPGAVVTIEKSLLPGHARVTAGNQWVEDSRVIFRDNTMLQASTPDQYCTVEAGFPGARPSVLFTPDNRGMPFANQANTGQQAAWGCNIGVCATPATTGVQARGSRAGRRRYEAQFTAYDGGLPPSGQSIPVALPLGALVTRVYVWLAPDMTDSQSPRTVTFTGGDGTVIATASTPAEIQGMLSDQQVSYHARTDDRRKITLSVGGGSDRYLPIVALVEYLA